MQSENKKMSWPFLERLVSFHQKNKKIEEHSRETEQQIEGRRERWIGGKLLKT